MKKVEYSQPVRRKLKMLKVRLTAEFGAKVATKALKEITNAARGLESFEEKGYCIWCPPKLFRQLFSCHEHNEPQKLVMFSAGKQLSAERLDTQIQYD